LGCRFGTFSPSRRQIRSTRLWLARQGELATKGQRPKDFVNVQTSDIYGIDRRRVSEWRDIRDAGPEVVEEAIQDALSEGRAPTKTDITSRVAMWFMRTVGANAIGLSHHKAFR
jgi:hypothetical protein